MFKKKNQYFPKKIRKIVLFGCMVIFWQTGASYDKNEYNLFLSQIKDKVFLHYTIFSKTIVQGLSE